MKRHSIGNDHIHFAQSAQRQFAELNRAIRNLRDNMNGMRSGLRMPRAKGGRRYTRSERDRLSVFEQAGKSSLGNYFARSFLSDVGLNSRGSFYTSPSQVSSSFLQSLLQGQRNS